MELHIIDIIIIVVYIAVVITVGFLVSKKASKNIKNYFLGGNDIPWYVLGISNASGMFDITGTMWLVSLAFVYGLKSVFLPWAWPIFNQIFLMVYLSAWLRRSNVMTGAEWIKTRFGTGKGAQLSHIIIVVFAMVSVVGFLAYEFKGIGKFSATFLPWDISPDLAALLFMGITTFYVIKGGMYSVVLTELIQFVIMTIASIAIGIIAMNMVNPEMLNAVIPNGWKEITFGWNLDLDWSGIIDSINTRIASDEYSLFGIFFMMILFKGILISTAGPAPNYDMQRILATKSPKEAAKMSGFVSVVLFFPRYMMIAGLTVLALVFFQDDLIAMGPDIDLEMVLPYAIKNFIPVGLTGVLLAGLLAAFMSTFAATVNAAPAYLVNDIYKRFINPDADPKVYVRWSYVISFIVVAVGIGFGLLADSVDQVTLWIVNSLYGGYTAANLLKWYWWRFNGYGYFWGMVSGFIAILIVPILLPELKPLASFPFVLGISLVGAISGCLLTKPDEEEVLKSFYKTVRPWGFWKPIMLKVMNENPDFKPNRGFKLDAFNVAIGIIWQTSLIALPMYLVIQEWDLMILTLVVTIITSLILKFTWYNKLDQLDEPA